MERHGRRSASELGINVVQLPDQDRRPEPPATLGPRAAEVWRDTVSSLPPRWFEGHGNLVLLESFCVHVGLHDHYAAEVTRAIGMPRRGPGRPKKDVAPEPGEPRPPIGELRAALDSETRLIAMLSSKLRICRAATRTSQSDGNTLKNSPNPKRLPWNE